MKKGTQILLGIGSLVFLYWWLFKKKKVEETSSESAPPPPPPSSPMPPIQQPPTEPPTAPPTPPSTEMQPTAMCVKYSVTNTRPIVGEDVAESIDIDYMTCQGEPDSTSIFDSETAYVYAIEGSIKSSNPNSLVISKV
jgi:hypothetical protein